MREIKRTSRNSNDGEIDLTPMLDVVFIMLIFFIVTASFIKEAGVDVQRPEASTWRDISNQNILVAITSEDEIWIDKQKIDPRDLRVVIERMHLENPQGALVIQADEESTAEKYAMVWDAARKARVMDVHLASTKIQ